MEVVKHVEIKVEMVEATDLKLHGKDKKRSSPILNLSHSDASLATKILAEITKK
jgi:hypothetical protein